MSIISLKNAKEFNLVNKNGTKKHGLFIIMIHARKFIIDNPNIRHSQSQKKDAYSKVDSKKTISISSNLRDTPSNSIFLGMKVSKRLSKKAVVRNKVKRQIRSLARIATNDPNMITDSSSIIIIPKAQFCNASFAELEKDFKKTYLK